MATIKLKAKRAGAVIGRWALPPGDYIVGRGEEWDLTLMSPAVSKKHAKLKLTEAGEVEVQDLDSSCGTYLDGQPVERSDLLPLPQTFLLADVLLEIDSPVE